MNGSVEQGQRYVDRGFLLSAGPGVLRMGFKGLKESLAKIPAEYWVLESDSPDQPEGHFEWGILGRVAEAVGKMWNLAPNEVLNRCSNNLQTLFSSALVAWVASMELMPLEAFAAHAFWWWV